MADGLVESVSPYSPFQSAAEELGYAGDPTLEPSPFFTTMHGYRTAFIWLMLRRSRPGARP